MKFLVIVNESPWGSSVALSAWRFVHACLDSGVEVPAVFFRGEGVYNALSGEANDAGTENLTEAWLGFGARAGTRLLLCSSSRMRRLSAPPNRGFTESGLTEMFDLMLTCDRVVSF